MTSRIIYGLSRQISTQRSTGTSSKAMVRLNGRLALLALHFPCLLLVILLDQDYISNLVPDKLLHLYTVNNA